MEHEKTTRSTQTDKDNDVEVVKRVQRVVKFKSCDDVVVSKVKNSIEVDMRNVSVISKRKA